MKAFVPVAGIAALLLLYSLFSLAQDTSPGQTAPQKPSAKLPGASRLSPSAETQHPSPAALKDLAHKDSLEKALAANPADSIKVKLLFNLDQANIATAPAKSLEYEKQRLAIGIKNNDGY